MIGLKSEMNYINVSYQKLDDKEYCNVLNEKIPKEKYIIWNSILNTRTDDKVQKE